jgi:hypothetical protein
MANICLPACLMVVGLNYIASDRQNMGHCGNPKGTPSPIMMQAWKKSTANGT